MRQLGPYVLFLGLCVLPRIALADDEKAAAERFREGRRAFEAHDYQRAATEFEAANRAKPAAAATLSAGLAWELGGDPVNAATDLAQALAAGGLQGRDEATARAHLAHLDNELGHLSIRGPASGRLTIDGHERGAPPIDVRVLPGNHAIELQTSDAPTVRRFADVTAGVTVDVDMTPPAATPTPQQPAAPSVQRPVGWLGLGIGASAFVAGAIVGAVGISARDQFVSDGTTSVSLHDEAVTMRTVANVLWATAGVFAVTGAILIVTAPHSRAISVGVAPSSVNLRVVF